MKSTIQGTPPNHRKSTGPERTEFGGIGIGEVGGPLGTTLENHKKFHRFASEENEFMGGVGGATGTAA
jgi:hypothetical protein